MTEWKKIASELSKISDAQIERGLAGLTSFGVGGAARLAVFPKSRDELENVMIQLWNRNIKNVVIGRGTNLLIADTGFDGAIVVIDGGIDKVFQTPNGLWIFEAGASLTQAIIAAANSGYAGLENLAGIPGSVGGAVKMNAGAYGVSFADKLVSLELLTNNGFAEINANEIMREYRKINLTNDAVIVSANVQLEKDESRSVIERIENINNTRAQTQPLREKSAGCIFKNPEGMHAGMMIDRAGLKAKRVGGAMVSTIHANFIVNTGNATADDIMKLIETVRKEVLKIFGVMLELEIVTIGF